jgi:hypothetical protein
MVDVGVFTIKLLHCRRPDGSNGRHTSLKGGNDRVKNERRLSWR